MFHFKLFSNGFAETGSKGEKGRKANYETVVYVLRSVQYRAECGWDPCYPLQNATYLAH